MGKTYPYCNITHSCNAISEQQYLSHCSLSLSGAGVPALSLWLDEGFLQALCFYSVSPRWIAPVKRQRRWSVSAVMVNEGNDSIFENMLMAPLETAIPQNLEQATFSITSPGSLWRLPLRVGRDFHIIFRDQVVKAMDTMCIWDRVTAVV